MGTKTIEEKRQTCRDYFTKLSEELADTHEVISSCNQDATLYLIPRGTIGQMSYYSKPLDSYRYSDHWNWYANTRKCPDPDYIQCECADLPRAKSRPAEGKPSKPVFGICVARFCEDQKYHTVFGERFDCRSKTWTFG